MCSSQNPVFIFLWSAENVNCFLIERQLNNKGNIKCQIAKLTICIQIVKLNCNVAKCLLSVLQIEFTTTLALEVF